MEVPIPDNPDPQLNLIQFKRPKREGTLTPVSKAHHSCKHDRCFIDEGRREITCQECEILLDPFQVLYEMATKQRRWLEELDEWDARRDSLLSERYDAKWRKDLAEIGAPPKDPETLRIWESFRDYFKGTFVSMYRRKRRLRSGPQWYGCSIYGAVVSFEYAQSQLDQQVITPQPVLDNRDFHRT